MRLGRAAAWFAKSEVPALAATHHVTARPFGGRYACDKKATSYWRRLVPGFPQHCVANSRISWAGPTWQRYSDFLFSVRPAMTSTMASSMNCLSKLGVFFYSGGFATRTSIYKPTLFWHITFCEPIGCCIWLQTAALCNLQTS